MTSPAMDAMQTRDKYYYETISGEAVHYTTIGNTAKMNWEQNNTTLSILRAAEEGGYGVLAAIVYNVEHITAFVQAAKNKKSPLIIQLFPSALEKTPSLVFAAAAAAKSSPFPISVHLDHAQDASQIKYAADNLPLDSIMVDMSHYEREENLEKTKVLTQYCQSRGIAVEAESGRINGGEDGIMDTGDLEAILTSPQDVEEFIDVGVDFLAPSVGNIHGDYGPKGPNLDFQRLQGIFKQMSGRVRLVLHGTNDFSPELMKKCIQAGVTKVNVNKLCLDGWQDHLQANVNKPLTQLIDDGIEILTRDTERWMDICGSSEKAA